MPSHLPRKASTIKHANEAMSFTAYQVGVLLCIERNRKDRSQEDVGAAIGVDQAVISFVENGQRPPKTFDNAKVDALFKTLGLETAQREANYLKWWRDNG